MSFAFHLIIMLPVSRLRVYMCAFKAIGYFFCRNACELEKKGNLELVEQRKAMEKNMISMAHETEQMRAELAKYEVRPWGTGKTQGLIYLTVLHFFLLCTQSSLAGEFNIVLVCLFDLIFCSYFCFSFSPLPLLC